MRMTLLLAAETEHANELPAEPYVYGLVALGILLLLLVGMLIFGKGRPHS
ncbi:MAG TPA: hypothetical protein VFJ14_07590 [Nocardioidaceae bacterium]|nr:hypothetical protein [Nocardioidaceae bacterium]